MNEEHVNVTVKMPKDLLAAVDVTAARLDLNRSQYFRKLMRDELAKAGVTQILDHGQPVRQETQPV